MPNLVEVNYGRTGKSTHTDELCGRWDQSVICHFVAPQ